MMKNYHTAIVTGASHGIGPYIVRALAQEGMNLVLAARSIYELEQVATAADMRATGVHVLTVPIDVTDREARNALVHTAERTFGSVDVLVNNAWDAATKARTYREHLFDGGSCRLSVYRSLFGCERWSNRFYPCVGSRLPKVWSQQFRAHPWPHRWRWDWSTDNGRDEHTHVFHGQSLSISTRGRR
jgi:NAD(P)-dependent dehydrogenase (short-subunit alcohol dehydrogenase family)